MIAMHDGISGIEAFAQGGINTSLRTSTYPQSITSPCLILALALKELLTPQKNCYPAFIWLLSLYC